MYKYSGHVEIITCDKTHATSVVPFYFEDKNQLTRDFVKLHVMDYLKQHNVYWVGIKHLTYGSDVV